MSKQQSTRVEITVRPYVIDFHTPHGLYPMTTAEVERLASEYPIVRIRPNRLTLRADDGRNIDIYPATLGGGGSFVAC
jgi:hypothetical protein